VGAHHRRGSQCMLRTPGKLCVDRPTTHMRGWGSLVPKPVFARSDPCFLTNAYLGPRFRTQARPCRCSGLILRLGSNEGFVERYQDTAKHIFAPRTSVKDLGVGVPNGVQGRAGCTKIKSNTSEFMQIPSPGSFRSCVRCKACSCVLHGHVERQ
jgi:hypothetical protein